MAVSVALKRPRRETVAYPEACEFAAVEHDTGTVLEVYGEGATVLAVYAPGTWRSATLH